MTILNLILLSILANSSPVTEGKISVAGNGCYGDMQITPVSGTEDRYELPIKVKLNKKAGSAFTRKTCNMRLPIFLKSNEKLQVSDVSQAVQINGRDIKSTLNISIVGQKTKPLVTTTSQVLKASGILVESKCGRDAMLVANLNVLAYGALEGAATTEAVQVTLKIVKCD